MPALGCRAARAIHHPLGTEASGDLLRKTRVARNAVIAADCYRCHHIIPPEIRYYQPFPIEHALSTEPRTASH